MPPDAPADLQAQARALGGSSRHEIFRYLADAGRPVDVAELTEHFGFNHNAIRKHLRKLVDAGLVTEDRAPSTGRGRPRLLYSLRPATESRWGVEGPYQRLSLLLAEMLRTGDPAVEVGRRSVTPRPDASKVGADPIGTVADAMARHGFDPEVRPGRDDAEIVLRTCPFSAAALTDPTSVCALHLGIAQGAADLTGGRAVIDELVRHDPRRADCRLRLHLRRDQP